MFSSYARRKKTFGQARRNDLSERNDSLIGPDQTPGEISSAHWSFATISVGRRWAAGGRADAHYQGRHTSNGASTQVQFCLSARMLVRGYGGFFTWRPFRKAIPTTKRYIGVFRLGAALEDAAIVSAA